MLPVVRGRGVRCVELRLAEEVPEGGFQRAVIQLPEDKTQHRIDVRARAEAAAFEVDEGQTRWVLGAQHQIAQPKVQRVGPFPMQVQHGFAQRGEQLGSALGVPTQPFSAVALTVQVFVDQAKGIDRPARVR